MSDNKRFYHGTYFGKSLDKQNIRMICRDCEGEEVLLPLDIDGDSFVVEWSKFSEAHRPCRNGQDEPDLSQGSTE